MSVLRFQRTAGITSSELARQLPAGSFTSVTVPAPGHMIDVTVTAGGVGDAVAYMTSRGYTLFETDPVPTLQAAAAAEVPPVDRLKLSDGTVLTLDGVANGQVLSRSGAGIVGTSAGASFDIRDQVAFDHFVAGSITTERVGILGWLTSVAGTGADLVVNGEVDHPGILDQGAGTVAAGRNAVYLGDVAGFPLLMLGATQGQIDMEWLIRLNANALSSLNMERYVVGFGAGFEAAASSQLTDGVYCELDPSASPNFRLVTAAASVRTRTDSTIVATAGNWWRIGFQLTYPAGVPTAKLLINGVVRATATATFPSAGVGFGSRIEANVTALEARCQTDYMKLVQITGKET